MHNKLAALLVVTALASCTAAKAQSTNTLSFSGATWNDGGSLDGYLTLQYDITGAPTSLLSANVTTGNAEDGFVGFNYVFNVSGQADTVMEAGINAMQNEGFAANEVLMFAVNNQTETEAEIFLDWQGSTPTSLYLGDVNGEHSSEFNSSSEAGDAGRFISDGGGSVGVVPEPSSYVLLGAGLATLLAFRRKR